MNWLNKIKKQKIVNSYKVPRLEKRLLGERKGLNTKKMSFLLIYMKKYFLQVMLKEMS